MWLDGTPYWPGIQMDETAFPILLVDLARREHALSAGDIERFRTMVVKAAAFIVRNGPVTQEDRWEEDPGYSPFTLAAEIAALLAAADIAELNNERDTARFFRETADAWNSEIERWIYVQGTDLAKKVRADGYYVRIAPPETSDASSPTSGFVAIKNRPAGKSQEQASHIVSPDALALVRFGLRAPDDPRIVGTVRIIDALLKVETPFGPAWHRYNDDGYGEHDDGSPFDGTGTGRLWPLLTGERAHYELAAGNREEAERLMKVMAAFANDGGMIPEQIWDSRDIPDRELFFGRPSGSAMPLVWAHAEYVKLVRSLHDGRVFDTPPQTVERYVNKKTRSSFAIWRFNNKCRTMPAGRILRIEALSCAVVHWSPNGWQKVMDAETKDTGLGLHYIDLPTEKISSGSIVFTFYWPDAAKWEGQDFEVLIK
jgi:glucoamylase